MYAHSDRVNGFKGDSMRRIGRTLGLSAVVALYWAWPAISQADPSLPNESGEDCLVTQSYDTILGLLVRDYSLRGNGQVRLPHGSPHHGNILCAASTVLLV